MKERPLPLASQLQTRHLGVAEPAALASRLTAVVQLDNGFLLEPGAVAASLVRLESVDLVVLGG